MINLDMMLMGSLLGAVVALVVIRAYTYLVEYRLNKYLEKWQREMDRIAEDHNREIARSYLDQIARGERIRILSTNPKDGQ